MTVTPVYGISMKVEDRTVPYYFIDNPKISGDDDSGYFDYDFEPDDLIRFGDINRAREKAIELFNEQRHHWPDGVTIAVFDLTTSKFVITIRYGA